MKRIIPFLIFLGIFIVLGIGFYFSREKNSSQDQDLKGIILFYGIGCPHCAKVEEFIKENKIKEKIAFEEKEVYFNRDNAKKLIEVAKKCGIKENEIGVPFLWDGENQRCIVGDEPIINFFKEKLNL
jgi:glutaredoxin